MEEDLQLWQQEIQDSLLQAIEEMPNVHPRLREAMSYACSSGGKRIRPLLVLTTSQWQPVPIKDVLPVAIALEMVHTYSLIHDDLPGMDNDDYRRGKKTVHKQFDEATAILAGDALLTTAFEQLLKAPLQDAKRLEAVKLLSKAAGASGMISGQMSDIDSEHRHITLDQLKKIHYDKTGQLLEAAVALGLLFLEDAGAISQGVTAYARHFGLAFQIQNDLQDVLWNDEQTGKKTGGDSVLEKNTYPSLLGIPDAKLALQYEVTQAKRAIQSLPEGQSKKIFEHLLQYLEI